MLGSGSGKQGIIQLNDSSNFAASKFKKRTLKFMMHAKKGAEQCHQSFLWKARDQIFLYCHLNVESGLEEIGTKEYEKAEDI